MTEDDVRREIFQAIIQCRGHNGPLINQRDTCEVLAAGVFETLKAKGLLKLDDDGHRSPRKSPPVWGTIGFSGA
jgi:hypothetical protein